MKNIRLILTFILSIVSFSFLACPPGTKTSVGVGGVTVTASCAEDRTSPAALSSPPDQALLLCPNSDGGTVSVTFPRKDWISLKAGGNVDAGPGK